MHQWLKAWLVHKRGGKNARTLKGLAWVTDVNMRPKYRPVKVSACRVNYMCSEPRHSNVSYNTTHLVLAQRIPPSACCVDIYATRPYDSRPNLQKDSVGNLLTGEQNSTSDDVFFHCTRLGQCLVYRKILRHNSITSSGGLVK